MPRLRVFAGPNGSGKTTILEEISRERGAPFLGVQVNADDIERELRQTGGLELRQFGLEVAEESLRTAFEEATWIHERGHAEAGKAVRVSDGAVSLGDYPADSYVAAVIADFLRCELLAAGGSFTFETVMSSADKVQFMARAQAAGYRTYLYYIALEDPEINVSRVENRVHMGGHPVSPDRVRDRYHRSLGNLLDAMRNVTRAYIFDNTSRQPILVAELREDGELEVKLSDVPLWFNEAVLERLRA